ncbi:MAG: tetratricopeptide repeat protein [candidate division Zixibacteria bacterium]|nr:tetratricopeptide repeat protein [candidate division Zixibacteria bacterium]
MRTKIKLTKQQIKEDKFTNFILRTRDQIEGNWQAVAIVMAVIVLLIGGTIYYIRARSAGQEEALGRLSRAVAELRRQNYQVAILEFKNLSDNYGGYVGGMALFNLANAYYGSKNYDEAIVQYQKYIDGYHLDRLTTASAAAGIAFGLESKQQFKAAGDKFFEVARDYPDSPEAPDFFLGAIRNYVQSE